MFSQRPHLHGSPPHGGRDAGVAPKQARITAFTLLELLAVMCIMLIMITLVSPSISSIMGGSHLTQAGQLVSSQLALAQQTALAKNRPVEVRFYQFANSETPAEAGGNGRYRALQNFEILSSGSAVPLGKCLRIPDAIVIDSGRTLSPLIDEAGVSSPGSIQVPTAISGDALQFPIPVAGTAYNGVSFRFRPDGSTELPVGRKWFLTLHHLKDGDNLAQVPANFVMLQIDPVNGHVRTFRP